MIPFVIYVIVLTLAYLLYYVGVIAMDLKAQSKKETLAEETIPTELQAEDNDEEYAPRTVIEDGSGGFRFELPEKNEEEEIDYDPEDTITSDPDADNVVEQYEEPAPNEEYTEPGPETEPEPEPEDEYENITTSVFSEEEPEQRQEEEQFDANSAFDPDLALKPFGITAIIEPQTDPVVEQRINKINSRLVDITPKENLFPTAELSATIIKNTNQNIERHDEYTRF